MTAERESMTLQEMGAPALGVEERRDEAPRAGASHARPTPDPEVVAKPKRRKFTAQYRLRILEEAESCTQPGEVGRLLRREGLVRQANWQKVGGASPPERRSSAAAATGSSNAQTTRSTTGSFGPAGSMPMSLSAICGRAWKGSLRIRAHEIKVSLRRRCTSRSSYRTGLTFLACQLSRALFLPSGVPLWGANA